MIPEIPDTIPGMPDQFRLFSSIISYMATFFIDYVKLVRQAYEQMQANNTLPHGLTHLTPATLKDECVMKCGKGLNRRDERVIRVFCGDMNESKNCRSIIEHCDTDKFKPLVNFLKGKSVNSNPKNIELLAWLIDFPNRPWETGKTFPEDQGEGKNQGGSEARSATGGAATEPDSLHNPPSPEDEQPTENTGIPKIPGIPAGNEGITKGGEAKTLDTGIQGEKRRKPAKRLAAAVALSLVVGTGGIWWWKEKNQPPDISGGCMYWMDDHYEPVACNRKIPNTIILALDSMKVKNFKKITTPDTISYMALGRVWYSKIDGQIEYFTSSGVHPVKFNHRLKPITIYIIDKYIRPDMSAE